MPEREPTKKELFRQKIIKGHQSRMDEERRGWQRAAEAYRSEFFKNAQLDLPDGGEQDLLVVENNWLHAFAETMVANIVPTNPEVSINPRRQELEAQARFRGALINHTFQRVKLHSKLWAGCTRATIYPRVFFKMAWDKRRSRPRIRVINPEFIFYDTSAEEWDDIRYIIEAVPMTRGEFSQRIGKKGKRGTNYRTDCEKHAKFGKYPDWLRNDDDKKSAHAIAADNFEWTVVYEYYDLVENKLYHMLEDDPVPLFEGELPYFYLKNPYLMLAFNDNLQDTSGISDAQLAMPTIEALNEICTIEMQFIQATIPKMVVHENLLDNPDDFYTALRDARGPDQAIGLAARQNAHIQQIISHTPTPSLPVNFQAVKGELRQLIEFILGIASYQRGGLGQSDVATELALSDTAIRTRNAKRQKAVYNIIEGMAEGITALYMQYLDDEQSVALRLDVTEDVALVRREDLGLGPRLTEGETPEEREDDVFGYEYEARPFNAQENNSIAQLKMLTDYIQFLIQNPQVDQRALTRKLLDLIHMDGILLTKEQAQAQAQQMAAAQGGAPPGGGEGGGTDAAPGVEELATTGQVNLGSGGQAVEGGMEGGPQPASESFGG